MGLRRQNSSVSWGMTPVGFTIGKQIMLGSSQRPVYLRLRLFFVMTSVTMSKTSWVLLVSVAQVKWG